MQICFQSEDLELKEYKSLEFRFLKFLRTSVCTITISRFDFSEPSGSILYCTFIYEWIYESLLPTIIIKCRRERHCAQINMDSCLCEQTTNRHCVLCFAAALHGVWMAGSIGHETMRTPRHESRRLLTKEILLTPNHKKRVVKKILPEPTAISVGYLEGA